MAIIVIDTVTTKNGLQVTNMYVTINGNYTVEKVNKTFNNVLDPLYNVSFDVYYKLTVENPVEIEKKSLSLIVDDISIDIHEYIYTYLKSLYTNTIDA